MRQERQTARPTTGHQCGCSGEPGPEPTEPIGRPVGVVPTPTRPDEPPRAAADGALSASVPRLSVEPAGGTGRSKRSQPFDVAPGAPARPPALPSFDVAPGAPARPPAWPGAAAVPELAAPLDAAPPAPPAPPPCVRAGCDAHVMRATSNKESFFVAMIRSLRLERTIQLGPYGSLSFAQARQHRGATFDFENFDAFDGTLWASQLQPPGWPLVFRLSLWAQEGLHTRKDRR